MIRVFDESVVTDDLIQKRYLRPECRVAGACYIVSEAAYHLFHKAEGYFPVRVTLNGVPHWWLENKAADLIDYTASQFDSLTLATYYKAGVPGGFLTSLPSKRARVIMARWLLTKTYGQFQFPS